MNATHYTIVEFLDNLDLYLTKHSIPKNNILFFDNRKKTKEEIKHT
jgi:hypothetical protein